MRAKLVVKEPRLRRPTEKQMSETERSVRAQQRRGALEPAGQQVGARRLAEGALELAAEVGAGEAGGAGHVLDADLLRVAGVGEVPGARPGGGLGVRTPCPQSRLAATMLGTYVATLLVCGCSLAIGQAAIAALRGAALVLARARGRPRPALRDLLGDGAAARATGVVSAIAVSCSAIAAVLFLRGRLEWERDGVWTGLAVASLALLAASLPFIAEGHFGILGTGFNPDMSQHLLTSDRLAARRRAPSSRARAIRSGRTRSSSPSNRGWGSAWSRASTASPSPSRCSRRLTALAAFAELPRLHRVAGALVVGLAYMVASYFAQGAFKETMQALFVLAFVLALREAGAQSGLARGAAALRARGADRGRLRLHLQLPGAGLARGRGGDLDGDRARARPRPPSRARRPGARSASPCSPSPSSSRRRSGGWSNSTTSRPSTRNGPGLGNLFGQVSPFEALGHLALGRLPALARATAPCRRSATTWGRPSPRSCSSTASSSAGGGARPRSSPGCSRSPSSTRLARLAGTPYTTAKAIEVAAPIAALVILLPLLRRPVGVLFVLAAGGCSLLALANAPVGPTDYSPALTGLRPLVADGSTLVLASDRLLDEEQGERYLVWELRGGRVCIEPASQRGAPAPGERRTRTRAEPPPASATSSPKTATAARPSPASACAATPTPTCSGKRERAPRGQSDCPLIAVRQARQGPAG